MLEDLEAQRIRPDLLWHYTDFNGLKGILDGHLWASSVAYLNDTTEFQYVLDITREIAGQETAAHEAGAPGPAPAAGSLDRNNWKMIATLLEGALRAVGRDVFVASFSRRQDDLSQWRAYGAAGPKLAIGFDTEALRERGWQHGFELHDVSYSREAIEKTIRATFRNSDLIGGIAAQDLSLLDIVPQELDFERLDHSLDFLSQIIPFAARCKHASFAAEEEWRLARRMSSRFQASALPLKFRQSGSLVIPYVELTLHDAFDPSTKGRIDIPDYWERVESPIRAIMVGPSPHPALMRDAVNAMANRKGVDVAVTVSEVPFRNW